MSQLLFQKKPCGKAQNRIKFSFKQSNIQQLTGKNRQDIRLFLDAQMITR